MDDIEDLGKSESPRTPNGLSVVKIRAMRKTSSSSTVRIPEIPNLQQGCCRDGNSEGCCTSTKKSSDNTNRTSSRPASPDSTTDEFLSNDPTPSITNDFNPTNYSIYLKTWGCSHNSSDSEYMAGILQNYGFNITDNKTQADAWILNSCTVKGPAEHHFQNEVNDGLKEGKKVIVSGCVPQADPSSKYIKGLSIIGVQQIDKVVEVVEESLQGNVVRILGKKKANGVRLGGSDLSLPKIRRNPLIEIIPVSTGCLNQCTYCKTKHARGHLASYSEEEIINRALQAFSEGVKEIWLTSEDTGAYGIDLGTNIVSLLRKLVNVIPDGCMLRIGMTNPPYILNHLEDIAEILDHPRVYAFLHVPVQSGSDYVLGDMKREYNVDEFQKVVDVMKNKIPNVTIATDIICGFPTETEKDFQESMTLCEKNQFKALFINQFYPRKGTPAAKMTKIDTVEVKRRTKILSDFFRSYFPYTNRVGEVYDILVTEISHDQQHYVGHNKFYEQILVEKNPAYMGNRLKVKIVSTSKHSMIGVPVRIKEITFIKLAMYFILLTLLTIVLLKIF